MKKSELKLNIYVKSIVVLSIILFSITIIHLMYNKFKNNYIKNTENDLVFSSKYEILKNELNSIDDSIEKGKNVSFNENIYMLDFYKKASSIYENKLIEINDVIYENINDDDKASDYKYNYDKFINDLNNDAKEINRLYESTIQSSLEIYKSKYEKLKNKCYSVIDEYSEILD